MAPNTGRPKNAAPNPSAAPMVAKVATFLSRAPPRLGGTGAPNVPASGNSICCGT